MSTTDKEEIKVLFTSEVLHELVGWILKEGKPYKDVLFQEKPVSTHLEFRKLVTGF